MARGKRFLSTHSQVEVVDFPTNPEKGQTVFRDGIMYVYSTLGGLSTWFPLNQKQATHVHSQGQASTTWTISHGLETNDVIAAFYDDLGNLIEGTITTIFNSEANDVTRYQLKAEFTEAVVGHAVIFAASEIGAPSVTAEYIDAQSITVNNDPVVTQTELDAALQEMSNTFQQFIE